MAHRLGTAGWTGVQWRNLSGGIVALHRATKAVEGATKAVEG